MENAMQTLQGEYFAAYRSLKVTQEAGPGGGIMLHTRLCELLEIQAPVLGVPMGPEIAGLDLAAAVSNAGGLGMISFGGYPPPALRERIRKLRTMTSRPFGVNVLLGGPHLPS